MGTTAIYTEEEISHIVEDKALVKGDLLDGARQQIMQQSPPPLNPTTSPMFAGLRPEAQEAYIKEFEQAINQYQQQVDTQAVKMAKEQLFEQLKAYRTGRYSVVVIQSPNAPTTQISNFYELEALKDMVPPEILAPDMIRATGIPKESKDEMIRKLEAVTQQVSAQPQ